MDDYTENKIKVLYKIADEINAQILQGRGIYLINSKEGMEYVLDAIGDHLDFLTGGTLSEENENIADNILDLFDQMEELKND